MRTRYLLVATILVCFAISTAAAQVNSGIGITPIFGKISSTATVKNTDISLNDDLGIGRNATLWEGWAAIYTRAVGVRGYYLFPVNLSADSLLPASLKDVKVKTDIPINTTFGLRAGRVELGIPLFNDRYWILEPFFLYQNLCPTITVQGKDFDYSYNTQYSSPGVGINLVERIGQNAALNAKFFVTQYTTQFDINAMWSRNHLFCGLGYTHRVASLNNFTYRLSGLQAEIGVAF